MRSTRGWCTAPTCSRPATAVEGIDVPEAAGAVNDYPVAVLADAPNPAAAQAFVDLVLSDEGRAVLEADGFGAP